MASKTSSKGQKEQYSRYKTEKRWEKNKICKIQRHVKKHENDSVSIKKLESMNFKYPRRIPGEHKPPEQKRFKPFTNNPYIPNSIQKQLKDIWVWNVS